MSGGDEANTPAVKNVFISIFPPDSFTIQWIPPLFFLEVLALKINIEFAFGPQVLASLFAFCFQMRPVSVSVAPAYSHCFSFRQGRPVFQHPNSKADPAAKTEGSRGKVSLERVRRLTLTLGLHFSKCVCVQLQLPRSPLQRVFTFQERSLSPTGLGSLCVSLYSENRRHAHTKTHTRSVSLP